MKSLLLASAIALALSVPASASMHGGGGHMGGGFHGGVGPRLGEGFAPHERHFGRAGFFYGSTWYPGCPWWAQVQGLCLPY
jgi:hypothetical protein